MALFTVYHRTPDPRIIDRSSSFTQFQNLQERRAVARGGTHAPFAAMLDDGFIYGRGALDMKNMVAMELMTMLTLKRAGLPLRRDVIFLASANEETGGI